MKSGAWLMLALIAVAAGCEVRAAACGGDLVVDRDDLDGDDNLVECIHRECAAGAPSCTRYGEGCFCDETAGEGESEAEGEGTGLTISWTINGVAEDETSYDSCEEVGAASVTFTFTPDTGDFLDLQVDCTEYETSAGSIPEGTYGLSAQLSSSDELGSEPITVVVDFGKIHLESEQSEVTANFGTSDFIEPRMGQLRYSLTWDGSPCNEAMPQVTEVATLLTFDGTLAVQGAQVCSSDECVVANGVAVAACADEELTIENVTWGDYVLSIEGANVDQEPCFQDTFDLLVGAGENPVVSLDVGASGVCTL